MMGKVLVSVAVTVLLGGASAAGQAAAQQSGPALTAASDSSFLQMAGSLGLLAAKLGRLAADKGSSPMVREFGQRMVTDYATANEEIAAGTRAAAYPAPVILRQHALLYERFVRIGKGSFDRKYLAEMQSQQAEAGRLFQAEAEGGTVASVKAMAARMLPAVQQRLMLARETAGAIGATVTATAQGERQGY
jgi:putative membrane protein